MSSQPEREVLLDEIEVALRHCGMSTFRDLADAALRVIERANSSATETLNPCTCGQNGYPPNSPLSNHPHLPGCYHFDPQDLLIGSTTLRRR